MGTLLQVVFDIFAALGIFVILMRMNRAPKDDPRLSRGLQLLQSKISVLEDLSDRTETQVNQLGALLDQKSKEVQAKIQLAESHVQEIKVSMQNSLEVAKIFQDKIPHQEIIERQNSIKYVQAARLAHQGVPVDEIAKKIDLPKGEIEFIAKVNRDQLMFNEEHLPPWAKAAVVEAPKATAASESDSLQAATPENGVLEHLALRETTSEGDEQSATRLRAEIEIAERQRLVENLSRLQFEMQNLDMQLAREAGSRDLSTAFEVPKIESESLQKIGEEFRKAVEDANEHQAPALPRIEQLSALIPNFFQSTSTGNESAVPTPVPTAPPAQVPVSTTNPVSPIPQAAGFSTSASYVSSMAKEPKRDLAAARAMARDLSAPKPATSVINARGTKAGAPVVRKVQFPKIESPEG